MKIELQENTGSEKTSFHAVNDNNEIIAGLRKLRSSWLFELFGEDGRVEQEIQKESLELVFERAEEQGLDLSIKGV